MSVAAFAAAGVGVVMLRTMRPGYVPHLVFLIGWGALFGVSMLTLTSWVPSLPVAQIETINASATCTVVALAWLVARMWRDERSHRSFLRHAPAVV